jgi:acetoin utilization protein AcuC
MELAILYHEKLKEYDFGAGHSFRGDRYEHFARFLREKFGDGLYELLRAQCATDEDLRRICDAEYIDFTRTYYRAASSGLFYDGGFNRYHSIDNMPVGTPGNVEEAARLVVGQARLAADLIQTGRFKKVVSVGGGLHHARANYGEGFCIYNDVAFAAKYLIDVYKLDKILILDTDAHAGNGTSEYFYEEPRVLFIDLHQDPSTIYPGSGFINEIGSGKGKGYTVNVPLPLHAGCGSYRYIFDQLVRPLTEAFAPQIIIRNGGSDPYFADGLTQLGLPLKGFKMIGQTVREISRFCGGKVIDMIASGYNKSVLPQAWSALIAGLGGFEITIQEVDPMPPELNNEPEIEMTKGLVQLLKKNLGRYWPSLL